MSCESQAWFDSIDWKYAAMALDASPVEETSLQLANCRHRMVFLQETPCPNCGSSVLAKWVACQDVWDVYLNLIVIVKWMAFNSGKNSQDSQLTRHFADTAELPLAQIKAQIPSWQIAAWCIWAFMSVEALNSLAGAQQSPELPSIYCLPLLFAWWKVSTNQSTGYFALAFAAFGCFLYWSFCTFVAVIALEVGTCCRTSPPQIQTTAPCCPGRPAPQIRWETTLLEFLISSPGFFPVTVNSARCPSCPSCPSCPKNPKYVRIWFPGNLDPGRSHICDKIFWRPCAIPCV